MRKLVQASAHKIPLQDKSFHCCVTSPPYYWARKYEGEQDVVFPKVTYKPSSISPPITVPAWRGSLGHEPTPEHFIGHLVDIFREVHRVTRDDSVTWIVIADSYWDSNRRKQVKKVRDLMPGEEDGNLVGVPHRLMFALQGDGWVVRNDAVWHKCLSGGAMVYAKTQKGEMPMTVKDMVRLDPSTVELWDGEKWNRCVSFSEQEPHSKRKELSAKRRKHKYETGEELPVMGDVEIELRNGERIGCTRDHRWPIEGLGFLVRAEDLKPGYTLKSTTLPEPEQPRMPSALSDNDIGWFVGIYLAEGSKDSSGTIQIASHINETVRLERLEEIANAYDGYVAVYQTSENGMSININSPVLLGILDTYISGNTAKYKHLHVRCWKRSNLFLASLLQGYLDGDGHWDGKRWKIGFCNNDALAADLRAIASRVDTSLRLRRCFHTFDDRKFPGWRGDISDPELRRTNDYEIVAIRQSRARKFWEITLEDKPHLFALTCGVLTHNSNPMPESVRGWTWSRCRVKVRSRGKNKNHASSIASDRNNPSPPHPDNSIVRDEAQWRDCAGCPKCEPTDGLVLRRGSWRHTRAQETVLMCVKRMGYFTNQEAVREPAQYANDIRETKTYGHSGNNDRADVGRSFEGSVGRNPRSVLSVSGEPLKMKHYAAFPKALIAPLIRATCPGRCCAVCGAGWVPIIDKTPYEPPVVRIGERNVDDSRGDKTQKLDGKSKEWKESGTNVVGFRPSCTCPTDDWTPGTVLDPFVGSGTVLSVAHELGLNGIGLDLSHSYLDEQAKVRGSVGSPSNALDGLPMFEGLSDEEANSERVVR